MSVAHIAIQLPLRGFACFAFDFVSKRKLGIRGGALWWDAGSPGKGKLWQKAAK